MEGTTHYVVQVHYENVGHKKNHRDTSGFDLCTTDTLRPNDAALVVFGAESFDVPPHGSLDITCDYPVPPELDVRTLLYALPHMHTMGTLIETTLEPEKLDLGKRDPWTYGNQYWTKLEPDTVMHAGDTVKTRCAWVNPTSADVPYGESVGHEMCSSFTIYYPAVAASGFAWGLPQLQSQCHPSP
jgi:hypothetical protein